LALSVTPAFISAIAFISVIALFTISMFIGDRVGRDFFGLEGLC
jgi:hypothetical protein